MEQFEKLVQLDHLEQLEQLEQLEHRVASDISTILSILTENRQPTPSNVAQITPTPTSTSTPLTSATTTNVRLRRGISTTDRTSPPSLSLSTQSNVADAGLQQHHLSQRSASQPTDISQVNRRPQFVSSPRYSGNFE